MSVIRQCRNPGLRGLDTYGAAFGDVLNYYVSALETTGRFEAIGRPSIFTENNRRATILSGQRVAIPTGTLRTASDADSVSTQIQYEDIVLKLEVIPLITPNGDINLKVAQINDSIQGSDFIEGVGEVPRIATQEIQTTITVPNKATLVMGGLITEEDSKTRSGLPFISGIPVLGQLFSSTSRSAELNELVILIQPMIIENEADLVAVSQIEKDRGGVGNMSFVAADPAEYSTEPGEKFQKKKYKYVGTKNIGAQPVHIPVTTLPPGDQPPPTISEFESLSGNATAPAVIEYEVVAPPSP
ncbi:MAG: type II and III secretion system protein [Bdellovibrionaceae bacterium]|nr:type II and III secretion system protein [Pseudobdellovibrionaceae bacterium]